MVTKMGYYVIMKEVDAAERTIQSKTAEWTQQMGQVRDALGSYIDRMETKAAGETAEAVCCYMREVHQYLLERFSLLFVEMGSRALQYAEGYYEIEGDRKRGEIAQESLEEQIQMLIDGQSAFLETASRLEETLAEVSGILGLAAPPTRCVEEGFQEIEAEAQRLLVEVGEYEAAHAGNDFAIMESMMDNMESLIKECTGKGAAGIGSYQPGSLLQRTEVSELQSIAEEQAAWFKENMETLQKAGEAYQNRLNAEIREEEGKQRLIRGTLIAVGAIVSAAVILGSGGSATPLVAAGWKAAAVGTLATTSMVYGMSEACEGIDDIVLGAAGDGVTAAVNPVRDIFPEEMQGIYYFAGEGSTIALSLWSLGTGAVEIYRLQGMTGVITEGGKIGITAVGTGLIGEQLEAQGLDRSTVMLLELGISAVIYGSLSKMQSVAENYRRVNVDVGGAGSTESKMLTTSEAEEYAFNAIKGPDSADIVVLGKYEEGSSTSYDTIAKNMDAQYFNLDNWDDLSLQYSREEIWKINERFLDIQTSSGREIYLSHDPIEFIERDNFFSKEIQYLIDNGYRFVKEGSIWHAIR